MRGSAKHIGDRSGYQKKQHQGNNKGPPSASNEFRGKVQKMKRYLEDESSLFKDIEKSTEYYQDALNINVESAQTDTAPVDVEDIQLVERDSSPSRKSRSRSDNSRKKGIATRHHQTSIQSTENQI